MSENWGNLDTKAKVIFKKEVKKKLIDNDLSVSDIANRLGYQKHTVEQALGSRTKLSKFLIQALATDLDIDLETIKRRAEKDGK